MGLKWAYRRPRVRPMAGLICNGGRYSRCCGYFSLQWLYTSLIMMTGVVLLSLWCYGDTDCPKAETPENKLNFAACLQAHRMYPSHQTTKDSAQIFKISSQSCSLHLGMRQLKIWISCLIIMFVTATWTVGHVCIIVTQVMRTLSLMPRRWVRPPLESGLDLPGQFRNELYFDACLSTILQSKLT